MADLGPWHRLYRLALPVIAGAAPLASPFSAKVKTGLEGRRGLRERLEKAADRLQGCIWFHVTSVGEYEQARPVIAALKENAVARGRPIAVTHYSPSGREYAGRRPCADFHDYLPFDTTGNMRDLVRWWNPRLLVIVKFDFWPNMIAAASDREIPVILLAGSLQPRSLRLLPGARSFFRKVFDRFTALGVCSQEDRERFAGLGVRTPITVTGDTRAEQVILRYEQAAAGPVAARLRARGGRLLILGSTWPQDENLWLPILPGLLESFPDLGLVLAPHEPLPHRLNGLQRELTRRGIGSIRLSALMADGGEGGPDDPPSVRCVLVDSVGVLAEIYRTGCVAYVGGSFTSGVHNTLEPAVCGLPVLFGPVIQNAEEAGRLVARGAGFVVAESEEARKRLTSLLSDPADLARRGALGREVVLAQRGATEKSLALLEPYL